MDKATVLIINTEQPSHVPNNRQVPETSSRDPIKYSSQLMPCTQYVWIPSTMKKGRQVVRMRVSGIEARDQSREFSCRLDVVLNGRDGTERVLNVRECSSKKNKFQIPNSSSMQVVLGTCNARRALCFRSA